jgi:hypothetical protein
MSEQSLYEKYLESITREHLNQITKSIPHQDAIVRFGRAMTPFNVRLCISLSHDGHLSLMAIPIFDHEVGELTNQLLAAGFEVAEPFKDLIQFGDSTKWIAKVSGHDMAFELRFYIKNMEQVA